MTTVDPAEKKYELDPLVTRALKRGDLTRINSNKPGKLKDHHGDLARIVKATAVGPTLENSHPFVYDLELVLGGKLHEVFRADLLYTTASQEGMTDDSRSRRKRKPSSHYDDQEEEAKKAKTKAASGKKKKALPQKGKTATTASTKPKLAVTKSRSTGDKGKNVSKKAQPAQSKAKPALSEDPAVSSAAPVSQAMDLFERHKREFERSLGRLEKADAYNFFGTEVPDEFQESHTRPKPKTEINNGSQDSCNDSASDSLEAQHHRTICLSQSPASDNPGSEKNSNTKQNIGGHDNGSIYFPTTPPFNFVVIRQRMERGRYILDRVRLENEERIQLLTPYWKSLGRKNINRRPKKSQVPILHPKGIDWDAFRKDIHGMCQAAVDRHRDLDDIGPGTLGHAAGKIKDLMEHIYEKNGRRHFQEMSAANDRHRFFLAMEQKKNTEAAMQGKWKRDAFPERKYERLRGDVVCAGLSELDQKIAAYELKTTLEDKFIGLAYKYDDTGQSEGWMKSVLDVTGEQNQRQEAAMALASDEGAIKAQVNASMQSLLIGVLDKVMTEKGVLQQKELRCANTENEGKTENKILQGTISSGNGGSKPASEFVVQEVWGIDCYTRRNVSICLETELDSDTVQTFTEKWLLPAINACPVDLAHDISNACRMLEGLPFDLATSLQNENGTTYEQWKTSILGRALLSKIATYGPPWLKAAARLLRRARDNLGPDFFRIHPKGHGSIVLCERLEPNRLVTFYRGEVYPSWRWGEKIDAITKIQEQKGLKPVLPDFFNMALERPQHDPRGYGLLFVDASRKSNYGSMLSHSCQPSCEVHVVAVNGELRLAITTIREMTIGDELTFDYNAVTESLFEYQSAVCLCGHSRCSGSFLHFAAADCYQQVLQRNSPVASRLANLIKGCTKKVMAEEDDRILKRHGFQTAAFGAVSVNRRNASALDKLDSTLDSMSIVPVWLRTFVADTLRYIEYERRALPIALICNDIYDETGSAPPHVNDEESDNDDGDLVADDVPDDDEFTNEAERPEKRSKPEPTFFYFARTQREYFLSLLSDDDEKKSLTGAEMKREVQKLASAHWKSLDAEAKDAWKAKAYKEWEEHSDRPNLDIGKKKKASQGIKKESRNMSEKKSVGEVVSKRPTISFQEADAEGVSAMEQRIQQLTQTLSRVGRVLDRHREATLRSNDGLNQGISDEALREVTHSPLVIMPNENVVAWIWNHPDGVVKSLVNHAENEMCVSPELQNAILDTVEKYSVLERFGKPWCTQDSNVAFPMSPSEGRERLNEALLELRKVLLDGIQQMATAIKKNKAKYRAISRRQEREEQEVRDSENEICLRSKLQTIMDDIVSMVERRVDSSTDIVSESTACNEQLEGVKVGASDPDEDIDPWLRNFNKRFKIEKAADLLLMYAKTGYFFSIRGYQTLKSSPIEVYARDLGNTVPAATIDRDLVMEPESTVSAPQQSPMHESHIGNNESLPIDESEPALPAAAAAATKKHKKLCDPEDIISNVAIEYQGDYVLAQLLQWYNAGIGQKPGLPDVLGCILLPSMKGCWTVDGTTVSNSYTDRATRYHSITRRRLLDWLKDPLKRGNPWPDEVRRAFVDKGEDGTVSDASEMWLPLGSPVLDFLVTGDDHSMNSVMTVLSSFHSSVARSDSPSGERLLSSVDEGRPAEAVSNWVQCENPACQKWRKVPWHIDINMLPDQFFCKDNVWNSKSAACDAPEDEWDQTTDAQVGVDGSVVLLEEPALDTTRKQRTESAPSFKLCDFRVGAQFDIRRPGKKSWAVGTVTNLDLAGDVKQVKIHYQNMSFKHDEWIEVESPRIAPAYSRVQRPSKKEISDNGNRKRDTRQPKGEKDKNSKRQKRTSVSATRPNEISDDASIEQAEKSHFVQTDDSSMADVFLQDSDDEDKPVTNKQFKTIVPRKVISDYVEENEIPQEEVHDGIKDPNDDVAVEPSNSKMVPVTDESSPDACDIMEQEQTESPVKKFTIPKKKKISPAKGSLLPTSLALTDEFASPVDQAKFGYRFSKKETSYRGKQSDSLLINETTKNRPSFGQDVKRPHTSPRPVYGSPAAGKTVAPTRPDTFHHQRAPGSLGGAMPPQNDFRRDGFARNRGDEYCANGRGQPEANYFRTDAPEEYGRGLPRSDCPAPPYLGRNSPNGPTAKGVGNATIVDRARITFHAAGHGGSFRKHEDASNRHHYETSPHNHHENMNFSYTVDPANGSPRRRRHTNEGGTIENGRAPRAYEDWRDYRSEGITTNYSDGGYSRYAGYGRDFDEGRYYRSTDDSDRCRRERYDSRDRLEGYYCRHNDYLNDSKGYNRYQSRYDRRYEDYDGYRSRRRYDRSEGHGDFHDDHYDKSPRRKHRSRRSRDRSRDKSRDKSRDRGKKRRSDSRSRDKRGHSEGKSGQVSQPGSTHYDLDDSGFSDPLHREARSSNTTDDTHRREESYDNNRVAEFPCTQNGRHRTHDQR